MQSCATLPPRHRLLSLRLRPALFPGAEDGGEEGGEEGEGEEEAEDAGLAAAAGAAEVKLKGERAPAVHLHAAGEGEDAAFLGEDEVEAARGGVGGVLAGQEGDGSTPEEGVVGRRVPLEEAGKLLRLEVKAALEEAVAPGGGLELVVAGEGVVLGAVVEVGLLAEGLEGGDDVALAQLVELDAGVLVGGGVEVEGRWRRAIRAAARRLAGAPR